MKKSVKDKKNKKADSEKIKELKDKSEIKEIREIKEEKAEESDLEEDLVPEEFESRPLDSSSKILSIARDLAFQPAPVIAQPLETMMENVPGRGEEEGEKSGKAYFEFKKDYETGRSEEGEEEEKRRKYDTGGGAVDTGKREDTRGALPFERDEQKPGQAVTFREDYLERKEEESEEERKYDARIKVKRA